MTDQTLANFLLTLQTHHLVKGRRSQSEGGHRAHIHQVKKPGKKPGARRIESIDATAKSVSYKVTSTKPKLAQVNELRHYYGYISTYSFYFSSDKL